MSLKGLTLLLLSAIRLSEDRVANRLKCLRFAVEMSPKWLELRKTAKMAELPEIIRRKRLAWKQEDKNWTGKEWIVWSDESNI